MSGQFLMERLVFFPIIFFLRDSPGAPAEEVGLQICLKKDSDKRKKAVNVYFELRICEMQ